MRLGRSLGFAVLLILAATVVSQAPAANRLNEPRMTPSAPVVNFLYPRFSEEGFTQWILRGAKAYYDSEAQIRVEELHMRLFTGDERMAVEMELSSPVATLRLQENRAYSDAAIRIEGDRFELAGSGWEWLGDDRQIEIQRNAAVLFTDALPDALGALAPRADEAVAALETLAATRIRSHAMTLRSSETEHIFTFRDAVDVCSQDWLLSGDFLQATVAAPGEGGQVDTEIDLTGNLTHAVARGNVEIIQFDRTATAGEAEFLPREDRVVLRGRPQVRMPGAFVTGSVIRLEDGVAFIEGSLYDGRAQLILLQTGGLGIQGSGSLASETIVLADRIQLRGTDDGNTFLFEGRVAVLSGELEMDAGTLTVHTDRESSQHSDVATVGSVRQLIAEQSVRIDQSGQSAEAERVEFYPADERALLSGNPRLFFGNSEVRAETIELRPGLSIARSGANDQLVVVTLPDLPDLGYRDPQQADDSQPAIPTTIQSRFARMESGDERTRFIFTDAVWVEATNLTLASESLVVDAEPDPAAADAKPGIHGGAPLRIDRIDAEGAVVIRQSDRTARAGKAAFSPGEGRVVLEDQPQVEQPGMGKVSGHRMVLLQGQRRALVEGGPDGERARIQLPPLER